MTYIECMKQDKAAYQIACIYESALGLNSVPVVSVLVGNTDKVKKTKKLYFTKNKKN